MEDYNQEQIHSLLGYNINKTAQYALTGIYYIKLDYAVKYHHMMRIPLHINKARESTILKEFNRSRNIEYK